jgi:MFS family permease
MVRSFKGVKEADISFYAGLLIALFTFSEFLSGMAWAWISDRIGRRKTLLIGQAFAILTALTFGLSHSVLQAALARSLGGLSNPNVAIVQTCVLETARNKGQQGLVSPAEAVEYRSC